jgi:hypothetical protein
LVFPSWNSAGSMLTEFIIILIPAQGSPFH